MYMQIMNLRQAISSDVCFKAACDYLFFDEEFIKDLADNMGLERERLDNRIFRLDFMRGDCLHNDSRNYIFKMLVLKHLLRLFKENSENYLDRYWLDMIKKGGL